MAPARSRDEFDGTQAAAQLAQILLQALTTDSNQIQTPASYGRFVAESRTSRDLYHRGVEKNPAHVQALIKAIQKVAGIGAAGTSTVCPTSR